MWKTLIGLVRDAYELASRIKGHDHKLERLFAADEDTLVQLYRLTERVLRLELQLQHQKEQQATERENFKLQIENVILGSQRELPSADQNNLSNKTE
jgi:hypothetical protein